MRRMGEQKPLISSSKEKSIQSLIFKNEIPSIPGVRLPLFSRVTHRQANNLLQG